MDEHIFIKKAWDTCLELIHDRGYIVNKHYYDLSENDLKFMINNNTEIICTDDKNTKKICIKYLLLMRIKPSVIKDVVEEIKKELNNIELEIILVVKTKPNNSILKLPKEISNLQLMWIKQLQFNPTKHSLVPKHIKLNNNDCNSIIKTYNLTSKYQLPILLKDDVISKYYNYKVGDVIKITDTASSHNSNYVFYRCVR